MNFYTILDVLIRIISYLFLIFALWLILYPLIFYKSKRTKIQESRFRLKRNNDTKNQNSDMIDSNLFIKHIRMLLSATTGYNSNFVVYTFFLIDFALSFVTFIILFKSHSSLTSLVLFTLLVATIPYLFLRMKLYAVRLDGSYEAERLTTELINQYKINHFNMIEAIDQAISNLSDSRYSQKALFKLSLGLKEYKTEEEINYLLQQFTYQFNTQWSILLAQNLFLAIEKGNNVSVSLEDILEEIKEIKTIIENSKRINNEAFVIIKYMVPALYFLSIFAALKYFNFTITKFIENQIGNSMGLQLFIFIVATSIFNIFLYMIMRKPKYDF